MIQASADELRTAVAGQWLTVPSGPQGAPLRISGVGTDTRQDLSGRLFIALRGENHDGHEFLSTAAARGAVAGLVDRKRARDAAQPTPAATSPIPLLEVADTRVALSDLARFWRSNLRAKVVAITGSSGKTTTRRLIDAALSASMTGSASPKSFNNDIGVPLTILGAASDDGYLIVEIGMNHPGEISPLARVAAPHIAVVTMAGRAHIGGMGSAHAIVAEKATIVDGLTTNGMVFVNGDQPELVGAVSGRAKPGVRIVPFGTSGSCQWRLLARQAVGQGQRVRIGEPSGAEWEFTLSLPGDYNAMNALAAVAVARALGVSAEEVTAAIANVQPADMRMARQDFGSITVYNDAYNSNPDSVLAALRAFAEVAAAAPRRVVVLGDMLELGSAQAIAELHAEVGRAVGTSGAALAAFVGEGCAHAHQAAKGAASGGGATAVPPQSQLHFNELDATAIESIAGHLKPGDAVLVKGSRGSRMERLVTALRERFGVNLPCSTT